MRAETKSAAAQVTSPAEFFSEDNLRRILAGRGPLTGRGNPGEEDAERRRRPYRAGGGCGRGTGAQSIRVVPSAFCITEAMERSLFAWVTSWPGRRGD